MALTEIPEEQRVKKIQRVNLWDPHPAQKKIMASPARNKVICCGRQFGKTVFAVNTLLKRALVDGGNYWYVAPTYKQAKQIAWSMLLEAVKKLPKELVKKTNESELYVIIGNNAKIYIKGADEPDSLRGVALNGAILDEYAFMKPDVFEKVIEPMFLTTNGWAIFISTPNGFNHFYDLFIAAKSRTDWDTFHFTSYDNPFASKDFLDEKKRERSAEAFAQEYMAEFRKKEGLVYKEFDHDTHVKTPEQWKYLQMIDTIAGIDFGFNNPSAIVVIKRDFDNRFWVVDEWKKSRMTTTEVAEKAKNMASDWNINAFYPDPAAPAHIEDIRRLGVNVRESNKDIEKGIEKIASLLKNNRLFIDASCADLIEELDTYSYPDMESRRGVSNKNEAEKPIKENDHLLDALRYALFTSEPMLQVVESNFTLYGGSYR